MRGTLRLEVEGDGGPVPSLIAQVRIRARPPPDSLSPDSLSPDPRRLAQRDENPAVRYPESGDHLSRVPQVK